MGLISRVSSRTYRFLSLIIMQIFLKNGDTTPVDVEPTTTIGELQAINEEYEDFNFFYCGEPLDDVSASLEDYGIETEATIEIVHLVLGGGRKRKKKVYTTPKKIKHKRVKVKMATLKLYKVDDVGKLERKRKECPHEMCGAGIFLSNHKDRQYCGKCGLTIKFNEQK